MDQSPEITNIVPTESTSSDRSKIPTGLQVNNVKQEDDCLIHSKLGIKIESQEDGNEFPVFAGTTYGLCPNYEQKIETDEPMVKIECEDLVGEIMQDPLDVGSEIKVQEQISIDLNQGESWIKTESFEDDKDGNLLESDKDNLHESGSIQSQDQLLIRNDSDRKDKKHVCHVCNKTFTYKHVLQTHLRIHTGEKPFTCVVCKKSFNQKGHLDRHMLIHSGEKPYVCNICKKVFSQKSSLHCHNLIHSSIKQFSCYECNKSFIKKSDLVRHKRIHTGEKLFTCDLCKKAFTDKSALTQHRRLHTEEKTYFCDICKKSFAQQSGLYQHKQNHKH